MSPSQRRKAKKRARIAPVEEKCDNCGQRHVSPRAYYWWVCTRCGRVLYPGEYERAAPACPAGPRDAEAACARPLALAAAL